MREFVVVSRCSEPLPASVASHLAMPEVSGSLFRAAHCSQREAHGGHTRLVFRFLERPRWPNCDHFFDGLAVSHGQLVDDEAALAGVNRPTDFVESARGVFGLVYSEANRVSIFSDPLSVYPIWTWQDDDRVVVSNNTHLIRTTLELMGISVEKEPYSFAWQLIFNNSVDDLTGYRDIRWAPFGHYLYVEQNASGVRPGAAALKLSEPASLFDPELPTASLIEQAAEEVADNVATLCSGNFRDRVCDLTGGRDSRTILAAAMQQGLAEQIVFSTGGSKQTPDGNVAALIRRELGLRKGVMIPRPQRPRPDMLTTIRRNLFRTYGCFAQNTAAGLGRKSDRSILHLSGGFGAFRGVYLEQLSPGAPTPLDLLTRQIRARGQTLRPETVDRLTAKLESLFEERRARGFGDLDAGDQHYIEHRNRQFVGTQYRVRLNFEAAAYPLYSPAAIMAAFSMSAEDRGRARIPFELIDRLFPDLLQFPLAEGRWSSSIVEGHGMAERLQALEPVTVSSPPLTTEDQVEEIVEVAVATCPIDEQGVSQGQGPTDWGRRMAAEGKHWTWVHFDSAHALFRELIDDQDLIGAMEDVFDPDALRGLAMRDLASFTGSTEIRLIYRLLAAMLWLGDREIETPLEV